MEKAKKQRHKIKSRIKKLLFNEEYSEANHDFENKKQRKKDAKKLRRLGEEKFYTEE